MKNKSTLRNTAYSQKLLDFAKKREENYKLWKNGVDPVEIAYKSGTSVTAVWQKINKYKKQHGIV